MPDLITLSAVAWCVVVVVGCRRWVTWIVACECRLSIEWLDRTALSGDIIRANIRPTCVKGPPVMVAG